MNKKNVNIKTLYASVLRLNKNLYKNLLNHFYLNLKYIFRLECRWVCVCRSFDDYLRENCRLHKKVGVDVLIECDVNDKNI